MMQKFGSPEKLSRCLGYIKSPFVQSVAEQVGCSQKLCLVDKSDHADRITEIKVSQNISGFK